MVLEYVFDMPGTADFREAPLRCQKRTFLKKGVRVVVGSKANPKHKIVKLPKTAVEIIPAIMVPVCLWLMGHFAYNYPESYGSEYFAILSTMYFILSLAIAMGLFDSAEQ